MLLDPVRDDVRELEDAVNMYPLEVELTNDLVQMDIKDTSNQLVKGRKWYISHVSVHKTNVQICVIYSVLKKHMFKEL